MLNPFELGEAHNIPTRNPQSILHSFDLSRCDCAFQNGCGNIFPATVHLTVPKTEEKGDRLSKFDMTTIALGSKSKYVIRKPTK